MHVCTYVRLYTHICRELCIFYFIYTCIYIYICIYVCMCVCMCTYVYTYVCRQILFSVSCRFNHDDHHAVCTLQRSHPGEQPALVTPVAQQSYRFRIPFYDFHFRLHKDGRFFGPQAELRKFLREFEQFKERSFPRFAWTSSPVPVLKSNFSIRLGGNMISRPLNPTPIYTLNLTHSVCNTTGRRLVLLLQPGDRSGKQKETETLPLSL